MYTCATLWDLTHDILALFSSGGGLLAPAAKNFLYWQHSTIFLQYVRDPALMPASFTTSFKHFAHAHWTSLRTADLPFF